MSADAPAHAPAPQPTGSEKAQPAPAPQRRRRLLVIAVVVLLVLGGAVYAFEGTIVRSFETISTDDAYVNGHVTFVAPRVAGEVLQVFVDDNQRVNRGTLLVRIDPEPYRVQVEIQRALLRSAEANVTAAEAQARSLEALGRSQRWKVQAAVEQVNTQIATLRANVAVLRTRQAALDRARRDLERAKATIGTGATSREEYDQRVEAFRVAEAQVNQAQEEVYQVRASLGLPPRPEDGNLTDVSPNLDQTFSGVRSALAELTQTLAQLGLPLASTNATPESLMAEFRKLDRSGDIDRILANLVPKAPPVLQARAKLQQAQHDLEQAELNLSYCEVRSEIGGVVTRRNVNPGNYVQAGQQLMAVRSIREVWVDANFKETQIADLRIGQRAELYTDMYGSRRVFHGRVSGFTMGTGSTLSLLPPQNATGNFVKVVQRLPVRIDLTEENPEDTPLFVGLSVTPYIYFKEPPTGPNAGQFLQAPVEPAPASGPAPRPTGLPGTTTPRGPKP